jgi:hypothetical protein
VTQDTATAVQGTFTGSGSGTLATFSGSSAAPTVTTADATITLDITGATLNTRTLSDGTTTADSLTLTGTITVSVAGGNPVSEPFTGKFVLTADPATTSGVVQGRLVVGEPHSGRADSASGVHISLSGSLDGDSLAVDRFVLIDATNAPAGTVFQSPSAADASKIVLTRS